MVAAAVAVAVDGEEDLRLDLREAVDDAADAEVGRAARPDRTEARARMEADHGLEDVRQVGDDPVAGPDPCSAERRGEAPRPDRELAPARLGERAKLRGMAHRDGLRVAVAERVLGVVERRAREPFRSGHRPAPEHALVRRGGAHVEELPDRRPERLELVDRPVPELVVALGLDPVSLGEPACVAGERRALDARLVRLPEDWRSHAHAEEPTSRSTVGTRLASPASAPDDRGRGKPRPYLWRKVIRPRVRSYGLSSTVTRSPGLMRIR